MKRYWMRWEEPLDESAGYRPMSLPLAPAIKGWWCSGEAGDGSYATLCAVVDAKDEAAAKAAIGEFWRPRAWSFCREKASDWTPGARFPMDPTPEPTP